MKNKNIKFCIGLILVVFLAIGLTGCDNGSSNIIGDHYSVTVNIEEIESEEHIDAFSVVADNSSRTTFDENNFDADNNSLNAKLTNLQGSVDIELMVDNDEIEGSYQLVRDTITVTGSDNIIFEVEWNDSDHDNDIDSNQYLLTGSFASSESEGQVAAQSSIEDVSQVVLIYSRDYEIHDVDEEGTFEIPMERGEPGGMAFVDEDGNFIGHLKLDEGLDSIPSQSLDGDVWIVDLGEIDEDGEPENNPIGNEYDISDNDLASMAVAETFFSAVAMNADFVEMLTKEGNKISISNTYFVSHTKIIEDDPINIDIFDSDISIEAHRLGFHISPGEFPNHEDMKLDYPISNLVGDNLEVYVLDRLIKDNEVNSQSINFPGVGNEQRTGGDDEAGDDFVVDDDKIVPQPGEYRLHDDNNFNIKFELPDITDAANEHLIVPVPEFEVDEEGKLLSVSWVFETPSGNKIDDPGAIIADGTIGFSIKPKSDGTNIIGPGEEILDESDFEADLIDKKLYEEGNLNIDDSIDLSGKNIYWRYVDIIDMSYNDRYGIGYMVPYINSNYNPLDNAYHVTLSGDNNVESENEKVTAQYTAALDHEVEAPVTLNLEGFTVDDINSISEGEIDELTNAGVQISADANGEAVLNITFAADVDKTGSIVASINETDDNIGFDNTDDLEIDVDTTENDSI